MREAISKVRLAELDGGGHWFYQEFPGAFETTVRWFLDSPPG
jgi:pimeloyl-ACP methyl ester carboxylesterase